MKGDYILSTIATSGEKVQSLAVTFRNGEQKIEHLRCGVCLQVEWNETLAFKTEGPITKLRQEIRDRTDAVAPATGTGAAYFTPDGSSNWTA
jgi:hypothetical protein